MVIKLLKMLREGEVALGAWVTIPHTDIPEMLSMAGFDWLLFDLEHGPIEVSQLESLLAAVKNGTTPLARVPDNNPVYIKRVLDVGVAGTIVPLVETREEAERAVRAARYPPKGIRGVGPRRAAGYGLRRTEYFQFAEDIMVVVQVETAKAVKNIREILSVKGVAAYFIGPNDLSFSFGYRSWKVPEVQKAITKVAEVGRKLGVPGGMYCSSADALEFAVRNGLQLLALGSDYRFLMRGAKEALGDAEKLIGR